MHEAALPVARRRFSLFEPPRRAGVAPQIPRHGRGRAPATPAIQVVIADQGPHRDIAGAQAPGAPEPRRQVRFDDLELLRREPIENPADPLEAPRRGLAVSRYGSALGQSTPKTPISRHCARWPVAVARARRLCRKTPYLPGAW